MKDNEKIEKSYLTKEELLKMLETIDFICVEQCKLDLITGFITTENDKIKPLSKTIEFY